MLSNIMPKQLEIPSKTPLFLKDHIIFSPIKFLQIE